MRYGGLILAIIFAAVAAILVLRMSGGETQAPVPVAAGAQEIKGVPVYVAAAPIPVGTAITQEMVTTQQWPEHLMLAGFIKADKDGASKIVGMVARSSFQQAEPIIDSKLANPNDPNFLAGELPKGMRVVTIPMNEVDGVAGFVFPGDHVDLIYTHEVEKFVSAPGAADRPGAQELVARKETISETLLTNVKVLAVDQRSSNAGSTDSKGNLMIPRSASVMVSQADSQRVRLAQKTGTVSLALRSLADKESADPMMMTAPNDISQWRDSGDTSTPTGGIKVVRGAPQRQEETATSSSPAALRGAPVAPVATPITPQVAP